MNPERAEPGYTSSLMAVGQYKMNPPYDNDPMIVDPEIDDPQRIRSFHSAHAGGVNFVFADGLVRFINEGIQHTARIYKQNPSDPNPTDPFDKLNKGEDYGLYQRLFSRADRFDAIDAW